MALSELAHQQLLIGGSWTDADAGGSYEQRFPFTGETIGVAAAAGVADANAAVDAAHAAFAGWAATSPGERRTILSKAADLLLERGPQIAETVTEETGGVFYVEIEDATALFKRARIEQFYNAFRLILSQILDEPGITIGDIAIVGPEEEKRLILDFNKTAFDYPSWKTLVEVWEERVNRTPDAIALQVAEREFTYNQLNGEINRLARYLKETYHIRPDDPVAIRLPRSEWTVIAMLAVLKSGGAYVPVDPGYPDERLAVIVLSNLGEAKVVGLAQGIVDIYAPAGNDKVNG